MTRYLDTFFRHPWLYLGLAALILAGAVLAAQRAMAQVAPFTAEAVFAANLDPTRGRDIGARPPSEQYAELLGELMATDTFLVSALLRHTRLADEMTTEAAAAAMAKQVRAGWRHAAAGPNTVRAAYSCDDAALCAEVVNAVLDQYQEEIANTGARTTGTVMTFYREQLALAEQRLRTLAPTDPARDQARATYDALLARIADAELGRQLDEQTRRASFRVIAPATPPLERAGTTRAALLPLVAGAGAATALVIALVMVMTWADGAVRSPEQVVDATGLPVALVAAHARRRRVRRPHATPASYPAVVTSVHVNPAYDSESRRG